MINLSYRPYDQSIENPLRSILKGIKEFDKAVDKRIEAGDWKEDHINEIDSLRNELISYKRRVAEMAEDNW